MKKKDIKKMTKDQSKREIEKLKKDLFNMRFKKVNSQLEDTAKISQVKKDIARILTKINGKKK